MILSQLSRRHLVERRALGDPGVDDQQVDRAVDRAGFVEGLGDLVRLGDVAGDGVTAELLGGLLERLHPPAEQRQLGAGGMEMRGGRGADPGPAAGDQRMATFKRVRHRIPSSREALAERFWRGKART